MTDKNAFTIKELARNLLPPAATDLARKTAWRFKASLSPLLKKNAGLKNIHHGKRCFILATGPSISRENLAPLKNEFCISVSNFFIHPSFLEIKPAYHCIAPFHHPIQEEWFEKWMHELDAAAPDGTTIFFGTTDVQRTTGKGLFRRHNPRFLMFGGKAADIRNNPIDPCHALPAPHSVSIMALYAALFMGFKNIYLLGCDHDSILHVGTNTHFYDEKNHAFRKSGATEKDEWLDMSTEALAMHNLFNQYKIVKTCATAHGATIYNATRGSLLDVFERVGPASLTSAPVY
ncbi:MAG: hypothetical protein A2583_07440 [Bdellovibrionales bacterium RIFOXYD1_FULL_53_11]|nr:MAG: hypothetical protein A2583_07440 [Bdellovibrionales bacterium RIFOXYD1_FULL_53_11]